MADRVQMLAVEDSFDANGVFVPAGQLGSFDPARLNGKEPLIDAAETPAVAVVQVAPITVTGPNPVAPQQIPPGVHQTAGGAYVGTGTQLVGEVTLPAEVRLEQIMATDNTAEEDLQKKLAAAQAELAQLRSQQAQQRIAAETGQPATANASTSNDDDALVAGTVAEITATLGEKTDEQLEALRAAEADREKPRAGVLNAIKEERARRSA